MSLTQYRYPMTGGLDRSVAPLQADPATFDTLLNFRHARFQVGALEQTPYFTNFYTSAQGTYYYGGSQTEPTTSSVRLDTYDITVTDYIVRDQDGNQLQVFYQTTVPAAETIYTGCLLVINNVTALAVNLGSTLDVEMTGAATFRWRKNAGAWVAALVPSTAGVSIDGGNATLYFLANSGFAGTETWSWTRTDRSGASNTIASWPLNHVYYKGEIFFNSVDDRIMVVKDSTTRQYVISVGYRPVCGRYLAIFDDHLVIGPFRDDVQYGWGNWSSPITLGWSDKSDLHNFIPTDTNEADTYTFPNNALIEQSIATALSNYTISPIMGIAVIQQQMFVFTRFEVYYTAALGLPLVFSFQKFDDIFLPLYYNPIIRAPGGVYIVCQDDIRFFDGSSYKSIGQPVLSSTIGLNQYNSAEPGFYPAFGVYNLLHDELNVVCGWYIFVYQARWQRWHVRSADFDSTVGPVKCINCYYGGYLTLGRASRVILTEDYAGTAQPVYDATDGTVYCTPQAKTQCLGGKLGATKECGAVYIGSVSLSGVSATYYTATTGIQVKLYWDVANSGWTSGTNSTATNAYIAAGASEGLISFPRTRFRGIFFLVALVGTTAKPPYAVRITTIEPLIKNLEEARVER